MNFMMGAAMRKVIVNRRKISLLTAELNFVPLEIDLDKLEEMKPKIKKMNLPEDAFLDLEKIAKLYNEKFIAKDIENDFKNSGWKMVRCNDNN